MDEFGGSVGGGGRYDKMIGKFTGQDTPAVGFSIGFERIIMLLMERGFSIPSGKEKKVFLLEKNLSKRSYPEGSGNGKRSADEWKTGHARKYEEKSKNPRKRS